MIDVTTSDKIKNLIVWVFSNILRLKPDREQINLTLKRMVSKLVFYFTITTSSEVQDDALFGLSKCAKAACIGEFAHMPFLLKLLAYYNNLLINFEDNGMKLAAVHNILGGLTSSTEEHTWMVIEAGFLQSLCVSLDNQKEARIREVCWILSNLAIGDSK